MKEKGGVPVDRKGMVIIKVDRINEAEVTQCPVFAWDRSSSVDGCDTCPVIDSEILVRMPR